MGNSLVLSFASFLWSGSVYVSLIHNICFNRVCTDAAEVLQMTKDIELVVDILWLVNIYFSFVTTYYSEIEEIKLWRKIARKYFFDCFFVDMITTIPTLVTYYSVTNLYYLKLLRLYFVFKATRIIKAKISGLDEQISISK